MKETQIPFTGEMVRAILEGRKTQTRRLMAKVPADADGPYEAAMAPQSGPYSNQWAMRVGGKYVRQRCPYGHVGDRLWVRETWLIRAAGKAVVYRAAVEGAHGPGEAAGFGAMYGGWKPSIFMPRWASRLTLEITGVRVERVQQITNEDAEAEGLRVSPNTGLYPSPAGNCCDASLAFRYLWDSLTPKRGWEANPWVWVIEFKEVKAGRKSA